MREMVGWCRWCRDAVDERQARYVRGCAVVHAACMREYLLEDVGERMLAQLAGFAYREDEMEDETG